MKANSHYPHLRTAYSASKHQPQDRTMIPFYQETQQLPPPSLSQNDLIVLATFVEYAAFYSRGSVAVKSPADHPLVDIEGNIRKMSDDRELEHFIEMARDALRRYTKPRTEP